MKILYVEDNDDNVYVVKTGCAAGFTVAGGTRRRAGRRAGEAQSNPISS